MPSLPDPNRGDVVYDSMARLMLTRGVEGLTMRAIAEGTGIAPSTLVAQFTHRRRLLAWFCSRTCRARARHWEGSTGTVSRVCSRGMRRPWRRRGSGRVCARCVAGGRTWGRWSAGPVWRPDPEEVTLLTAVLAGLRTAMVRPVEPLALRDAVRVLERCAGEDAAHLLRE